MAEVEELSVDAASKLLGSMQAAIDASITAIDPLLDRYVAMHFFPWPEQISHGSARKGDPSLDGSAGLSLLSVRPQQLLASVNNLALRLAIGLSGGEALGKAVEPTFGEAKGVESLAELTSELDTQLVVEQEVMDKVRGMESKLDYQVKKLTALAEAEEKRGAQAVDDVEEGSLRSLLLVDQFTHPRPPFVPTQPSGHADRDQTRNQGQEQIFRRRTRGLPPSSPGSYAIQRAVRAQAQGPPCACSSVRVRLDTGGCTRYADHVRSIDCPSARRQTYQLCFRQARGGATAHQPIRGGEYDATRHDEA